MVGVEVWLHSLLRLAVGGGEWSASCPIHFIHRERVPVTYSVEDFVGPRAGVDISEKRKSLSCPCQDLNPRFSSL
jgi:hypothetical protein